MMLHDLITLAVVALCLWAIVDPRVPTGVVPTIGLCVVGVAALWSLDDWAPPQTVVDTMLGGLGLVGGGAAWRVFRRRRKCPMRRSTDWGCLDELPADELHRVSGGKGTP